MEWTGHKIYGPWDVSDGLCWCILAQRSDGAVFWQNLSVYPGQDFWQRLGQAFDHLDNLLKRKAPADSYVDFRKARVGQDRTFQ